MTEMENRLKNLSTDQLIDVVKNYRQYGYDDNLRALAISILENKGITKEQLQMTGNFTNNNYDSAVDLYKSFSKNSNIAFVFYGIVILTTFLLPILPIKSETVGLSLTILNFGALILYFVFILKSFLNQNQFYKIIGEDYGTEGALVYLFLGMPFYIFLYFYFQKQMKEKMKEIK